MTAWVTAALTMIVPVCGRASKPTNDRWISRRSLGGTGQPGRQVKGTSAGVSGPEVVAVNGGSAAPVTRAAEGRGDAVGACVGAMGTFPPDAPFDTEADAA